MRWFHHFAEPELDLKQAWQARVRRHVKGALKPPFNGAAHSDTAEQRRQTCALLPPKPDDLAVSTLW